MERYSSTDNEIQRLLLEKEKELRILNEKRIEELEKIILQKDEYINAKQMKINQIQIDFNYNLQLIAERDKELTIYENEMISMQNKLSKTEKHISELNTQLQMLHGKNEIDKSRRKEIDEKYLHRINDLSSELDSVKLNLIDETTKKNKEIEEINKSYMLELLKKDEKIDIMRRELHDTIMREHNKKEEAIENLKTSYLLYRKQMEERIKSLQDELKESLKSKEILSSALKDKTLMAAKLDEEIMMCQQENEHRKQNNEAKIENMTSRMEEMGEKNKKYVGSLKKEIATLTKMLQITKSQVENERKRNDTNIQMSKIEAERSIESVIEQLKKKNQEQQLKIDELDSDIEKKEKYHQLEKNRLIELLKSYQCEKKQRIIDSKEIDKNKVNEIKKIKKEKLELEEKLSESTVMLTRASVLVDKYVNEINTLNSTIKNFSSMESDLKEQVSNLTQNIMNKDKRICDLEGQLEKVNISLKSKSLENVSLIHDKETLESQLKNFKQLQEDRKESNKKPSLSINIDPKISFLEKNSPHNVKTPEDKKKISKTINSPVMSTFEDIDLPSLDLSSISKQSPISPRKNDIKTLTPNYPQPTITPKRATRNIKIDMENIRFENFRLREENEKLKGVITEMRKAVEGSLLVNSPHKGDLAKTIFKNNFSEAKTEIARLNDSLHIKDEEEKKKESEFLRRYSDLEQKHAITEKELMEIKKCVENKDKMYNELRKEKESMEAAFLDTQLEKEQLLDSQKTLIERSNLLFAESREKAITLSDKNNKCFPEKERQQMYEIFRNELAELEKDAIKLKEENIKLKNQLLSRKPAIEKASLYKRFKKESLDTDHRPFSESRLNTPKSITKINVGKEQKVMDIVNKNDIDTPIISKLQNFGGKSVKRKPIINKKHVQKIRNYNIKD